MKHWIATSMVIAGALAPTLGWPGRAAAEELADIFAAPEIVAAETRQATPSTAGDAARKVGLLKALQGNVSLAVSAVLLGNASDNLDQAVNATVDAPKLAVVPVAQRYAPTAVDSHTADSPLGGIEIDAGHGRTLEAIEKAHNAVQSGVTLERASLHAKVQRAAGACFGSLLSTHPEWQAANFSAALRVTLARDADPEILVSDVGVEDAAAIAGCLTPRLRGENARLPEGVDRAEMTLNLVAPN